MAFADAGEDEIVFCRECGYAANVETGRGRRRPRARRRARVAGGAGAASRGRRRCSPTTRRSPHAGRETIDAGHRLPRPAGRAPSSSRWSSPWRAARVAAASRRSWSCCAATTSSASSSCARRSARRVPPGHRRRGARAQGVEAGYVGPVPTSLPVYADEVLRRGDYVAGANQTGHHRTGVTLDDVAAGHLLRPARRRAPATPARSAPATSQGARVIEVGNIFQLGTKYSEPMGATFLDEDGKEQPIVMGSYGIGLARIAAAAIEQHHDDNGIVWPAEHRAVRRAPRAGARLGRGAGRAGRAALRGAGRGRPRRPLRRPRHEPRASSSRTPTCSAARCRSWWARGARGLVELKDARSGERRDVPRRRARRGAARSSSTALVTRACRRAPSSVTPLGRSPCVTGSTGHCPLKYPGHSGRYLLV